MGHGKFECWITGEGLAQLEGWARDGLIDEEIAKRIGINTSTLYDWKRRFPEIAKALKKGKEVVDFQVENALLKRALGYAYDEVMDEEGDAGMKRRVTKKCVPPDVTAQIFWLKNRRPDKWRDKPEPPVDGTGQETAQRELLEAIEKAVRDADA